VLGIFQKLRKMKRTVCDCDIHAVCVTATHIKASGKHDGFNLIARSCSDNGHVSCFMTNELRRYIISVAYALIYTKLNH
jgi:hypothetical protein